MTETTPALFSDMLRARVLAIAAGYEDVTGLDALRRDPAFLVPGDGGLVLGGAP